MISAEECQRYAMECEALARDEINEPARRRMLTLAKTWREMGRQMSEMPGLVD